MNMPADREIVTRTGRRWLLSSDLPVARPGDAWAALVLLWSDLVDAPLANDLAEVAVAGTCRLIVCVGPDAERMHDEIDAILEESDEGLSVVTTWHSGPSAISEAVATVEAIARSGIVRAFADDPALTSLLLEEIGPIARS